MKMMVDNFIDTQKNFIVDMEEKYIPEEQKNTFYKKKQEFLDVAKKYASK